MEVRFVCNNTQPKYLVQKRRPISFEGCVAHGLHCCDTIGEWTCSDVAGGVFFLPPLEGGCACQHWVFGSSCDNASKCKANLKAYLYASSDWRSESSPRSVLDLHSIANECLFDFSNVTSSLLKHNNSRTIVVGVNSASCYWYIETSVLIDRLHFTTWNNQCAIIWRS